MAVGMFPLVELHDFPDLALIVKAPTRVRYSNQAAGIACEHPEAEGYLVPLSTRVGRPELATFIGLFRGDWQSLDAAQADAVDGALHRHGLRSIRVDRTMLGESKEAWVHVVVEPGEDGPIPLRGLLEPVKAVLLWPNSD